LVFLEKASTRVLLERFQASLIITAINSAPETARRHIDNATTRAVLDMIVVTYTELGDKDRTFEW
jgi:hypothetical protein